VLTVPIAIEPNVRCHHHRHAVNGANRIALPPVYPTPSERSAKSASVVPTVVDATMVV
jgi:hypothetical protein